MKKLGETIEKLTPQEKNIARQILAGESIIDGPRLYLDSLAAVDQLLKVNELNWNDAQDRQRLQAVHNEATIYLEGLLKGTLDKDVRAPDDIRELFLLASSGSSNGQHIAAHEIPSINDIPKHKQACMLLKTMNVINHIDAYELRYTCPISLREISKRVADKIERELSRLKRSGFPIIQYEGGRKPKESIITKLLCKRGTVASRINDRLRFRIITQEKKDIVLLLNDLFSTVLPYNYVLPGTTVNQLVEPSLFMTSEELVSHKARDMVHSIARSVSHLFPHGKEEVDFTGKTYKVLKFVIDVPIRLDPQMSQSSIPAEALGRMVYSLVEIQIVDEVSEHNNQEGENAHPLYKGRQKLGVVRRMLGEHHG